MVEFNQEFSLFQKALKIEDPWYVIDYELNQIESKMNNGLLEGINSLAQAAKRKVRGYRTRKTIKS